MALGFSQCRMANVWMDTGFPDSPQAVKLCETLHERHAWCHALRLWAWGIDQDREDGVLHLDEQRIAEIASYRGKPSVFVQAMLDANLLRRLDDGSYYMCGWSRTSEYFKKKKRMRDYRSEKRAERDGPKDAPRDTPRVVERDTPRVPRYDDPHDDGNDDVCNHDLSTKRRSITRSSEDVASAALAADAEKPKPLQPTTSEKSSNSSLTAGDVFALLNTWGGRWIPAIHTNLDDLTLKLTPFRLDEVIAAKAEAEKLQGNLGFKLLLTKIKFARERPQQASTEDPWAHLTDPDLARENAEYERRYREEQEAQRKAKESEVAQ